MRRRRSAWAMPTTILAGALVIAGCGGNEQSQPTEAPAGEQLTVTMSDFKFAPASATVPSTGQLTVKAVNRGKAPHALTLETPQGDRSTKTLDPDQAGTLTADVEPGRYTWYWPVANHRQLGMTGTLTVKGAEDDRSSDREPSAPTSPGGGYGY